MPDFGFWIADIWCYEALQLRFLAAEGPFPSPRSIASVQEEIAFTSSLVIVSIVLIALVGAIGGSKKKSDEPFDPNTYESMDYASVAQNPDFYKDKKLYAAGTIVQVIEDDTECDLRLATAVNGYDDIVFVTYDPGILDGAHLTEGQYVGVYGHCTDQVNYTSALGAKASIPGLDTDSIDQTVKSPQEAQIETMQAMLDGVDFEKVDTTAYGTWEYVAKIQNTTDNDYSNVSIVLGIYDASGARIGETYANATSWAPGETVQFEGYLDSTKADAAVSVKPEIQGISIGSDYYSLSMA